MVRLRRLAASPLAPVALAAAAAVAAYAVSVLVFPYHSLNHDEAVYLQQAAMLLDGRLFLQPPVEDAFRPWFFVESARGLYPKYAPPTAAVYALGELAGSFRYALPAVAGATVALLYGVVREAWDRRTAAVAAVATLASPLFVVQSGVFLPYAPTTMLNLAFALAYFRAERTGSARLDALAGLAVGLAFFARPYTAVLFAVPFIGHAVWTLQTPLRETLRERTVDTLVVRRAATAGLGLAGVAGTLGYNAVVTGDPTVFPYQAFAPLDGLGFGHREILGYEQDYTVWLALRSNAEVVGTFLLDWAPFGVAGSLLAAAGLFVSRRRGWTWQQRVLAGVVGSVVVGNLAFWGNRNVLGGLADHSDGLVSALGPYYHYDLLVPASAFAAVGLLAVVDRVRRTARSRLDGRRATAVLVAALLVASAVLGASAATATGSKLQANADVTADYETAYEPFEPEPPQNAVVLLPDPYGDWLNHPFQALRNDPGFDGETLYALDDHALDAAAAYPDRALYRYSYRGTWTPGTGDPVDPVLREVAAASGETVTVDASFGLPSWTAGASITVESGDGRAFYTLDDAASREAGSLSVVVADGRVRAAGAVTPSGNASVPLAGDVTVTVLVDGGYGAGFQYRLDVPVAASTDGYRALSPQLELCTDLRNCGGASAYVDGVGPEGTWLNATVDGT
ncbi:ArnT family glycosyltransferase [Halobacterium jilantaiense]|uniref:Dolichyl-phosphate-mannose-protein mannosyltransferase n=1 Tax=Halobacterium jilantaiense TaxID=355548 RepID=A0A1I0MZY5_9EURY|nr:glycosyltransferase family 39 protein [Halobacterium jilantaiense]SEV94390.1 Dolichyl-phosphate-mannose-protein mannosyltransferase [Halobacterium jilantaiense]